MPELLDELRITNETPESIKARLIADTNAGIDPADPAYCDTTPGHIWDDLQGAMCLEEDRVYARMNQIVLAAIPGLSYGAFLDAWADTLGLERNDAAYAGGTVTFAGEDGTDVPTGTQVSTAQTSAETEPVTFEVLAGGTIGVSGEIDLEIRAVEAGAEGNVAASTVTIVDTPLDDPGVTVLNAAGITGGADVESDERLQIRVVRKMRGATGGGNVNDHENWALNHPGVGFVTVQPNTPTIGHVTVILTDINNDPMPGFAVDAYQQVIDPSTSPAQGAGLAPVGATVHVATPTTFDAAIVAELVLAPGYTLDGTGGTLAARPDVVASLARYVNRLPAGGDIVFTKALAAIVDVVGVVDVPALTINGTAANVAVGPTEVAALSPDPVLTV